MITTADMISKRIVDVRLLTADEMTACGWTGETPPVGFVLSNGVLILPAKDAELTSSGILLYLDKLTGECSYFASPYT